MIDKRNRNLIVRAFNLNVCEIAGKDASLCARKTPMSRCRAPLFDAILGEDLF